MAQRLSVIGDGWRAAQRTDIVERYSELTARQGAS
jgi:hypothetical protein